MSRAIILPGTMQQHGCNICLCLRALVIQDPLDKLRCGRQRRMHLPRVSLHIPRASQHKTLYKMPEHLRIHLQILWPHIADLIDWARSSKPGNSRTWSGSSRIRSGSLRIWSGSSRRKSPAQSGSFRTRSGNSRVRWRASSPGLGAPGRDALTEQGP